MLNQVYTITDRVVNGRPTYIDRENNVGMWWDGEEGDGDWWIGSYSNIDENRLTVGSMANDQDTACPSDSEHWQEYYNGWADNANAHVSCDGT